MPLPILIPGSTPVVGGTEGQALTVGAGGTLAAAAVVTAGTTWVRTDAPPAGITAPASAVDLGLHAADDTSGHDDTVSLQAILDLNKVSGGDLGVVVCGRHVVTGLTVNSTTRLVGLSPGAGLKRKTGANAPVLLNANYSRGVPTTDGNGTWYATGLFGNRNIALRGLTVHGNALGVSSTAPGNVGPGPYDERQVGIEMVGVDGLWVEGCTVYDCPTYHVWLGNCHNLYVIGCTLEVPNPALAPDCRDALHISNSDTCHFERLRLVSNDDAIAVNGNQVPDSTILSDFIAGPGPSKNLVFRDIFFDGACRGVDLLSSDMLLDNIVFSGLYGTVQDLPFVVQTFAGNNPRPGPGNVGMVRVNDFDVVPLHYGGAENPVWLNSNFTLLHLSRPRIRPDGNNTVPWLLIPSTVTYGSLVVDGLDLIDQDGANRSRVIVSDSGVGDTVEIQGRVRRPGLAAADVSLYRKAAGSLNALRVSGLFDRMTNVAQVRAGVVTTVQMSGLHSNAGGGGALDVSTGLTVRNYGHSDLLCVTPKTGAGSVTNDVGSGSYSEPSGASLVNNLIAYYKLGEAAGTPRVDSVNALNMAETNGTVAEAAGLIGGAASFAGVGSETEAIAVLSHAHDARFSPNGASFYALARFKITALPASDAVSTIVTKRFVADSFMEYELTVRPDGTVSFDVQDGTGNFSAGHWQVFKSTPNTVTLNDWHFVVAWVDANANTVNISIDGGTAVSTATTVTCGTANTATVNLGGTSVGTEGLPGLLDAFGFGTGYVPTPTDISAWFNGGAGTDLGF